MKGTEEMRKIRGRAGGGPALCRLLALLSPPVLSFSEYGCGKQPLENPLQSPIGLNLRQIWDDISYQSHLPSSGVKTYFNSDQEVDFIGELNLCTMDSVIPRFGPNRQRVTIHL
jgi:hypothetical protein